MNNEIKKRYFKKAILISTILIIFTTNVLIVHAQDEDEEEEVDVDVKTELQEKIEKEEAELAKLREELSDNLLQIQEIDDRIFEAEQTLEKLKKEITLLQEKIVNNNEELGIITKQYNTQKEVLDNRLLLAYEEGELRYLDTLLQSKSISEFVSSCFLLSEMANNDKTLLDEVENKKKDIEKVKNVLGKYQEKAVLSAKQQTTTATLLENTKVIRQKYTDNLSGEEKEIQAKIDEYNVQFALINKSITEIFANGIDTEYIGGVLAWPVPGYTRVTSEFGMRLHPFTGVYKLHTGTDIGAPIGASFIAANDGIVVKAEYNFAYGNMVVIDHGGGVTTLYAHGSEILVKPGDEVKKYDEVLKVGSTGYSTGPHAHFEVRINGEYMNPLTYITNGIIPGSEELKEEDIESKETENEEIENLEE